MQPRADFQLKPSSPICPNCYLKIEPGTQICPNCQTRICTYCYQTIPSMTARVCPNCGKHEVLKEPLSQMLTKSADVNSSKDYFESDTAYKCPQCKSRLSLRSSRRLSCKHCGFITSLDEYLAASRKPNPFYDVKSTIATKERISTHLPEDGGQDNAGQYKVPEKLTTHFEAKAESQKWWNHKGQPVYTSERKSSKKASQAQVYTRESGSSFRANRWKLGTILKLLALILMLALLAYGIYLGVGRLIAFIGSEVLPGTVAISKAEFNITSTDVTAITENGAVITWKTDDPATSEVQYGLTTALGNNQETLDMMTEHNVVLSGLEADTTYFYKVISQTKDGRSDYYESHFNTLAPPDMTPPVISGIEVSGITDIGAEISWLTDEAAYSIIDYGTSESYTHNIKASADLIQQHTFNLPDLSADTTYHFRITVIDSQGNQTQSQDTILKTIPPIKVGYELHNRAPDFTMQSLDGDTWTLSNLRGKLVMLNFWNLSCGPCRAEMPDIDTVYKTWQGDKPFQLLTINLKDYEIHLNNAVAENDYTFPILLDKKGDVSSKYGIATIPMTFFVDTNGIIQMIQRGRFKTADEIREVLNSL